MLCPENCNVAVFLATHTIIVHSGYVKSSHIHHNDNANALFYNNENVENKT